MISKALVNASIIMGLMAISFVMGMQTLPKISKSDMANNTGKYKITKISKTDLGIIYDLEEIKGKRSWFLYEYLSGGSAIILQNDNRDEP